MCIGYVYVVVEEKLLNYFIDTYEHKRIYSQLSHVVEYPHEENNHDSTV